ELLQTRMGQSDFLRVIWVQQFTRAHPRHIDCVEPALADCQQSELVILGGVFQTIRHTLQGMSGACTVVESDAQLSLFTNGFQSCAEAGNVGRIMERISICTLIKENKGVRLI